MVPQYHIPRQTQPDHRLTVYSATMPPPVSLVLKNNTQETCTFDGTSGNFWSTAPQNQTSISPGGEIHFTLNDDLMFHRAYGKSL
jgi:hypothetical protein